MNQKNSKVESIDIKKVIAAAKSRMRTDDNYKRTALMIALMLALINVPILIMQYVSTGFGDINQLTDDALSMINMRLILLQLMIALFVTPAFTLSKTRFMLRTMQSRAGSPTELFDGLGKGSYFVSVRATIWMMAMMYIWLMIPASLAINSYVQFIYSGGGLPSLAFMILTALLTVFVLINRELAYSMQFFLLAEQPRIGAIMSLRLSTVATHGRLMELFKLNLRMLLYIIPPMLPNIASLLLFRDSMLFGTAMALLVIALTALCYPVVESARAEYFMQLKAIARRQAEQIQRAHNEAWEDNDSPDANGESAPDSQDDNNGEIR